MLGDIRKGTFSRAHAGNKTMFPMSGTNREKKGLKEMLSERDVGRTPAPTLQLHEKKRKRGRFSITPL